MAAPKGHPRYGGRKKGAINKTAQEVGAFMRDTLENPRWQDKWRQYFFETPLQKIEAKLVMIAYAYAYGKPRETISVNGEVKVKQEVEQASEQGRTRILHLIDDKRSHGGNGHAGEPDPATPQSATA